MNKKKLLALLTVSAMTASLIGCSGAADGTTDAGSGTPGGNTENASDTTDTTGTTDAGDTTGGETGELSYTSLNLDDHKDLTASIKFLHHKTDREADGTMANMIAEFNKEFPNITVTTEAVTDYAEDALLRLSTGDWGDVMFVPEVDKTDYATYFMPLDTLDNLSQELNFVDAKEFDGLCYGIPYMANAQGLLYNKKVFEDAGITELPTTPEEFVADLQLIKDKTDAIPLYTNYAAGWTMGAWDAYVGIVSNGDNTYMNQKLVHTAEPFTDPGDGTGAYNVYKILYDACAGGLIEDDYTTTDWEGCKGMMNRGEIGTMVLGSWAFAQMQEAGDTPENVGYMPFPITVGGKQYVCAGGDYNYCINVNSSDENKLASLVFVKWMVEKSNWCYNEGGYTVVKGGQNPDMYAAFDGCEVLSDQPSLAGEETFLNDMNAESELSINAGGNDKVQRIVEAGATGSESFDDIMADWNQKWQDAQEELGIEVLY
ncbi:ABC-type glycerol-3-phosphate transport system, substrate-binding protein [Butyrivibrio fibrisolvens DSM 3071]|uniref:ABC-type glycerol-3-phosphate transport system, substrate-binding protein n=1 Tax=Butyrivibrio fibrisolvens DSM 3071 TaxID=1121131 RepID=A0A1M6APG3_BUTFI|nr:ABC transporter substrate-binding protein [Butyrivibrio fibrisolvens]SHI38394.1 ABC-type glycerol-3-phosphate transport system, substrate-binding protein [Butyrivibrio fibrisolvens DSM 3071]